jgi:hypothetical protein
MQDSHIYIYAGPFHQPAFQRRLIQRFMRMAIHFYFNLQKVNLPFSALVALLGLVGSTHPADDFWRFFFISLLTGGYTLSVVLFELRHPSTFYFYYNRGLTKAKLILVGFFINLLLAIIFYALKRLFHAI